MGCETASRNATPPEPAIAPRRPGTPAAAEIDPRLAAEALAERFGPGGVDPRVPAAVPGFDAPFFQAGLAGYSDAAMRLVARDHGCPYCVTEALLDRTLLGGGRGFTKADLGDLATNIPGGENDAPLAGQIMGSDPAEMAAAALMLVEQGRRGAKAYRGLMRETDGAHATPAPSPAVGETDRTFAAIDVNLACPVKKISKKARGGHWLAEPEGAVRILEAVRDAVPAHIPVTVKLRRAFDDSPAMAERFYKVFDAAYDLGCAWVTVHGRTVEQKYVGPSRWDALREIATRRHPGRVKERVVFGSGDVWSAGEVFRMLAYTGVQAVSVARGCIGNPWVFRQCRDLLAGREPAPPSLAEQRAVLERHFALAMAVNARLVRGATDDARRERAASFTARTMRKFAVQFSRHHPESDGVKADFVAVEGPDGWRAALNRHYPERGDPAKARPTPVGV